MAERKRRRGDWFLRFEDGSAWPDPSDPNEIEWCLRYGSPEERETVTMPAASYMAAYRSLIYLPSRRRAEVVRKIKTALRARPSQKEKNQ